MRRLAVALLVLAATTGLAAAGRFDATFAAHVGVAADRVRDVAGFALPRGGDYTHVLIGRFGDGAHVFAGVVLLRCAGDDCTGQRVALGSSDRIECAGIVDLEGAPGPVPAARLTLGHATYARLPGRRGRRPALVVRTTEGRDGSARLKSGRAVSGRETRTHLHLISLVAADRGARVFQDTARERYPNGAGFDHGYRLARVAGKRGLALIVTEQRELPRDSRCLRPKPIELRYELDGRRYRQVGAPAFSRGC